MTARSGSPRSRPSRGSGPGRWVTTPFSEERRALVDDASLLGPAFGRAYAALADRWLRGLLGEVDGVAVVAVGGYGRAELCPGSDLDVVLVHRGRRDIAEVAERLWYPIWDARVRLDHSVRTIKEALEVADRDLKAALGLLDARHVAGDAELGGELAARARVQWQQRARRFVPALRETVADRHRRAGEVAFLLEPELKEGKGGLRDAHTLAQLAAAVPISLAADLAVDEPRDVLLAARVELHRITGRALDRLVLQEQDEVARRLGLDGADLLMAQVASAGRTIGRASDDAWRRVDAWLAGPKGRSAAGADRPLGPGLVLREGEVELTTEGRPSDDPSLLLRAAAASAYTGAPLSRAALLRLAAEAIEPPEPWPLEVREALVSLLGSGENAVSVFETLDQQGLVTRFLPEWEAVRSKPQRNTLHRYTVDRHLIETTARATGLTRLVARPDLLLVAAWLHDLGKGYPGDHTKVGVQLMQRIATRMGFPPGDVAVLVSLVEHHLLLAQVATSRDLSDAQTIEAVATAVGDRGTLELLHALTKADSLATGELSWSDWKEELVGELVAKVASHLAGEEPAPPPREREHAALAARAAGGLLIEATDRRLAVVAPDRPGLFCRVVGLLTLYGQDVRAATASTTDDGIAVEVFDVQSAFDRRPDWSRFESDLARVLDGRLALEARLAERARAYASRPRATAARPAEPRVIVHDGASDAATVVEVRAPDGVGVLYRITRALADLHLDIRHAKVATLGHEVVDTFYVRDARGEKLDAELLAELDAAIFHQLASVSR